MPTTMLNNENHMVELLVCGLIARGKSGQENAQARRAFPTIREAMPRNTLRKNVKS
jgi:hypothetical protein